MAKIGDLARPSILFSSLDVETNVLLTRTKYQIMKGTTARVIGITDTADMRAPATRKATTKKSNRVVGSWSSLLPLLP